MSSKLCKIMHEVCRPGEWLLPAVLHIQVIEHLDQGDGDFVYVLSNHRFLQDVKRKLNTGKGKAGRSEQDHKGFWCRTGDSL